VNNSRPASDDDGPARPDAAARWQFLRGELDQQLIFFRGRRRRDKRKAFALQMATVTLSAIITVLLGLRTSDPTRAWLLNTALVLGALITVLAAAEAFYTHRRLWVLRTTTVRRLETLSRHLNFHTAGSDVMATDDVLRGYLAELDAIIVEDQKAWHHLRDSPATDPGTAMSPTTGTTMPTPPSALHNGVQAPTPSPRPSAPAPNTDPSDGEPSHRSPDR
jgi:hypothetical protein